jgi:hypothetical protein
MPPAWKKYKYNNRLHPLLGQYIEVDQNLAKKFLFLQKTRLLVRFHPVFAILFDAYHSVDLTVELQYVFSASEFEEAHA